MNGSLAARRPGPSEPHDWALRRWAPYAPVSRARNDVFSVCIQLIGQDSHRCKPLQKSKTAAHEPFMSPCHDHSACVTGAQETNDHARRMLTPLQGGVGSTTPPSLWRWCNCPV